MLKISLIETSTQCRVVLAGRIIGAEVKELKTLCTRLKSVLNVRVLVIDIKNVVLISQEGENALLRLINQGAKLGAEGVLAKCIVQQLAHRSKREVSDLVDASPASARKGVAHRPSARNSDGAGSSGNEIRPETSWSKF